MITRVRVLARSPSSIKLQFPDREGGVLMYVETELARERGYISIIYS